MYRLTYSHSMQKSHRETPVAFDVVFQYIVDIYMGLIRGYFYGHDTNDSRNSRYLGIVVYFEKMIFQRLLLPMGTSLLDCGRVGEDRGFFRLLTYLVLC